MLDANGRLIRRAKYLLFGCHIYMSKKITKLKLSIIHIENIDKRNFNRFVSKINMLCVSFSGVLTQRRKTKTGT